MPPLKSWAASFEAATPPVSEQPVPRPRRPRVRWEESPWWASRDPAVKAEAYERRHAASDADRRPGLV